MPNIKERIISAGKKYRLNLTLFASVMIGGCYMGPPNLSSVLQSEIPKANGTFEIGYERAQNYILEGSENSANPTVMGYHSYNVSYAFCLKSEYIFASPYLLNQTLIYPGLGIGIKNKMAYLAIFQNLIFTNEVNAWSWQGGIKVSDRVTIVAENYLLTFYNYDSEAGLIFSPADYKQMRAYRVMASIFTPTSTFSFNPYIFYAPDKKRLGAGGSLNFNSQ